MVDVGRSCRAQRPESRTTQMAFAICSPDFEHSRTPDYRGAACLHVRVLINDRVPRERVLLRLIRARLCFTRGLLAHPPLFREPPVLLGRLPLQLRLDGGLFRCKPRPELVLDDQS